LVKRTTLSQAIPSLLSFFPPSLSLSYLTSHFSASPLLFTLFPCLYISHFFILGDFISSFFRQKERERQKEYKKLNKISFPLFFLLFL
jgi:hypothetical protein